MIEQWFAVLNETMDDLLRRYPNASVQEKNELDEQWNVLKTCSDVIIESWLQFEDKMAMYRALQEEHELGIGGSASAECASSVSAAASGCASAEYIDQDALMEPYIKGIGYFKLQMFAEAADYFEKTLRLEPELNAARLFLAMCRMHLSHFVEAQRHFQLISELAEDSKLRAIAFNALGCIQAVFANLKQAEHYFQQAMESDPSFDDPRRNLASCRSRSGQMELSFGSSEIQALVRA